MINAHMTRPSSCAPQAHRRGGGGWADGGGAWSGGPGRVSCGTQRVNKQNCSAEASFVQFSRVETTHLDKTRF